MDIKGLETSSSAVGPSEVRCSIYSLMKGHLASVWTYLTLFFLGHSYFLWPVTKICSSFSLQSLLKVSVPAVFCLSCLMASIEVPFLHLSYWRYMILWSPGSFCITSFIVLIVSSYFFSSSRLSQELLFQYIIYP